ncbi:AEC family transporter [Rhodococcus sp. MEB064]|uniref:AEC family transporter n=1 Tax=Rhodococcus sp. MEB064 TaxID=1587522 RepID=UPI0005ACC69A|nr:AEC family transporter [Rhodococcus sp. MEB064]KIQ15945.1 membrane protein [Rhodococcus sp. MEB064]
MSGVLAGFTVIFVVIFIGYVVARTHVLGESGGLVLGRMVFFVATPALLFDTLARADLSVIFSPTLAITAVGALIVGAISLVIALTVTKRGLPEATIGALAASYVNAANLGIPIAVYVLGDASFVAPLLLFQIMIYSPLALTVLDVSTSSKDASFLGIVAAPFKNPIVLAGLAGLALAITGFTLPDPVMQPFTLLGGASVPGALLAFGMSLYGVKVLERGAGPRRDVALASFLKMAVLPVLTYALARWGWNLDGHDLFAVVVIAALPTAQNVFVYATRYGRGTVLARDTAFVTTIVSIPVIAVVAALLA